MNDANPYQPPEASLTDERTGQGEAAMATPRQRFIAAVLDGIIGMVLVFPLISAAGMFDYAEQGETPPFLFTLGMTAIGFLAFILVHGYFLKQNGQTIGKKIMGIKITGLDNEVPSLSKILFARYLPISLVTLIPVAGNFLPLVDSLFIFRSDRRCIHDLIAGTKVVQAKKRA